MRGPPPPRRRKWVRLRRFDYAEPGLFFVTICTHRRVCRFGEVVDGVMRLNEEGRIVAERWEAIETHHPGVAIDAYVVMPNHVHGIIQIVRTRIDERNPAVGATPASPHRAIPARGPSPSSLGAVVGSFKSGVTRRLHDAGHSVVGPLWQRGFYEHAIRDDRALDIIRAYIAGNPAAWADDADNPQRRSDGGATQASPLRRPRVVAGTRRR